jgi:hypothetical protein
LGLRHKMVPLNEQSVSWYHVVHPRSCKMTKIK